ncbi:MAG: 50S ribosomal protein L32 [Coriobacteriales bacterium]|nr:50S ribosomal protein L32 [Coriobacteriales bacterium]
MLGFCPSCSFAGHSHHVCAKSGGYIGRIALRE